LSVSPSLNLWFQTEQIGKTEGLRPQFTLCEIVKENEKRMEKAMKINRSLAENLKATYLESPMGLIEIQSSEQGVRAVSFVEQRFFEPEENVHNLLVVKQLSEYFDGKRKAFDLIFDLEGTPFQQRVWQELLKIPFGKTRSYMDVSRALGDPKAIRAVGTANGSNKIAIIIPCHRVIGSDGSLTGYAGGLHRKKWLLDFEIPPIQTTLF
jgi:methylated-DNA-[protein]-cysteine S-methyltransferase